MPDNPAVRCAWRLNRAALTAARGFTAGLRTWGVREFALAGLLFPLCLASGLWWGDALRLRGHALPGVVVFGEAVGGYSDAALAEWLGQHQRSLAKRPLRVVVGPKTFRTTPADLGISLNVEGTRREILASGRTGGLLRRIRARALQASGETFELRPVIDMDDEALQALVAQWQEAALELPVEGTVVLKGKRFVARDPKAGATVDFDAFGTQVVAGLLAGRERLEAPSTQISPKLTHDSVKRAVATAERLSGRSLRLKQADGEHSLVFPARDVRQALRWDLEEGPPAELRFHFAMDQLQRLLSRQREALEVAPQDARFEIDRREKIKILPSKTGTKIDEARLSEVLLELAASKSNDGVLPMITAVSPALTTADAETQNIHHLVGSFTTHHPCCRVRVKNIHRIADLLNDVLVRPGETFSLNEFVGPRTAANGFFPAPTIVLGDMADTIGGGISQFATTMFNAVLRGGYEIIERQPHSYYFSRYPAGHEATLSFPKPDLIFRNDTDNGLLLKTQYGGSFIRVKVYGDHEGRVVKINSGKRYASTEPKLVYEADDELPPDEEKIDQRGQRGFKVGVSRVVTYPDGKTKKEERIVTYKPRDRVVRVHSCMIPEGEEGHTGEDCPELTCDPETEDCEIACAPDDKACLIQRAGEWKPPVDDESEGL